MTPAYVVLWTVCMLSSPGPGSMAQRLDSRTFCACGPACSPLHWPVPLWSPVRGRGMLPRTAARAITPARATGTRGSQTRDTTQRRRGPGAKVHSQRVGARAPHQPRELPAFSVGPSPSDACGRSTAFALRDRALITLMYRAGQRAERREPDRDRGGAVRDVCGPASCGVEIQPVPAAGVSVCWFYVRRTDVLTE